MNEKVGLQGILESSFGVESQQLQKCIDLSTLVYKGFKHRILEKEEYLGKKES